MSTDSPMASNGRSVSDRAAAGGPIIRLKISSAPTTGSVMLVASGDDHQEQHISIRPARNPRASASSGITEESSSGRYSDSDRGDAHRAEHRDRQRSRWR